jgi:CCR4-NOT transcription complex subunit 7/8
MLKEAGLDFEKHAKVGINHSVFVKSLKSSGLISNKNLTWVAFNSSFDFAYMIKMLDEQNKLPNDRYEFLKKCTLYFPNFYDVKQLEISTGSLAQQAIKSDIKWEGNSHQAGSDSLVTLKLFCSKDGLQNQKLRKNEH